MYVDNLLVTRSRNIEIKALKHKMKVDDEMEDLGNFTYFLGIEFLEPSRVLVFHNIKYDT